MLPGQDRLMTASRRPVRPADHPVHDRRRSRRRRAGAAGAPGAGRRRGRHRGARHDRRDRDAHRRRASAWCWTSATGSARSARRRSSPGPGPTTRPGRRRRWPAWPGYRQVRAALTVVPYYSRPGEAGVLEHFRALAGSSPVPLLVYNVPYRTGQAVSWQTLQQLAEVARHRRGQARGRVDRPGHDRDDGRAAGRLQRPRRRRPLHLAAARARRRRRHPGLGARADR